MINEMQLLSNGPSLILAVFIFFSPFISLITNKNFLKFILGMKSIGLVYLFVLLIAFIFARGIFLLIVQSSHGLYGLPDFTFNTICFLSTTIYWYLTGKLVKTEKDLVGMITLMHAAEMFWFVAFLSVSAVIIGYI